MESRREEVGGILYYSKYEYEIDHIGINDRVWREEREEEWCNYTIIPK